MKKEKTNKRAEAKAIRDAEYAECMDIWYKWFEQIEGRRPKVDGSHGRALKSIMAYFRQEYQSKDERFTPIVCLKRLLSQWNKLPHPFCNLKDIRSINSQLNNILNILENGKSDKTNNRLNDNRARVADMAQRTINELRESSMQFGK